MANKESEDLKEPNESIHYETQDFPVISESGPYVDWQAYEKTFIVERLEEGIGLTQTQMQEVIADIHILEKLYNYGTNRLDWAKRSDGTIYLEAIFPDAGNGLWMYIFNKEGDHEHTPMEDILSPESKIYTHNLDDTYEAIFFVECLASYYKQIGIEFPHIKGNFLGIESIQAGGVTIEAITRDYSFEIPCNENFDYKKILTLYTNNLGIKMKTIDSNSLETYSGSKAILTPTAQGQIWMAKNIATAHDATKLFRLLSIPLKTDPQIFVNK